MVGFSAAKQLKAKPYVVAAVGGVLIDPNLIGLASGTASTIIKNGITYTGYTPHVVARVLGVTFNATYFGIPVAFPSPAGYPSYAYTIFPIICAAALAAPLGKWLHKDFPVALRPIFEPMLTFFIVFSVVLIVVGPIMNLISGALSTVITGTIDFNLVLQVLSLVVFIRPWLSQFYQTSLLQRGNLISI